MFRPNDDETREDFIARADRELFREFPSAAQRGAVARRLWGHRDNPGFWDMREKLLRNKTP